MRQMLDEAEKVCEKGHAAAIAVKHLTEKYGGTLVASQEKYILIIPKENRSNSANKTSL